MYEDPGFRITPAGVATPNRFYPLANTTARLRRDPLWAGLSLAGFAIGCVALYGYLLYPVELLFAIGVAITGVVAGSNFSILRMDAAGHPRVFFVGPHLLMKRRFHAFCSARSNGPIDQTGMAFPEHQDIEN